MARKTNQEWLEYYEDEAAKCTASYSVKGQSVTRPVPASILQMIEYYQNKVNAEKRGSAPVILANFNHEGGQ